MSSGGKDVRTAGAGAEAQAPSEPRRPELGGDDDAEGEVRAHHARGDHRAAATVAMKRYGRELFRFVHATVGSEHDAADVSSELWEDVWIGLPKFAWRSTFRTWAYTLARHTCVRFLRHPNRRRLRPLSEANLSRLEQQLRTSVWFLKDDVRDGVANLRQRLDPDERALLYLRVDREMPWREIAGIMQAQDGGANEAALRQQFARVKKRLRELAEHEGLLPRG